MLAVVQHTRRSFFVLAVASIAAVAHAADRPRRQPTEGGEWQVTVQVLESKLAIPAGNGNGVIWFGSEGSRKFQGASSVAIRGGGKEVPLTEVAFQLDADEDPRGAEETYSGVSTGLDRLGRALTSSDFSVLPIRAFHWHHMTYDGSNRSARKTVQAKGHGVEFQTEKLGATRARSIALDQYFTKSVRRYPGSGFEIHDYIFTAEYESAKENEHYVAFASGYRVFVMPELGSGAASIALLARFQTQRLDWGRNLGEGEALVDPATAGKLVKSGDDGVVDALFVAMQDEGIGNPFDSSALAVLEKVGLFDASAASRLVNIGQPRPLAMIAPLLVAKKLAVDGAKYKKAWSECDDPAYRLLLAAGAKIGGKDDPNFTKEAQLALKSKDPIVLRSLVTLANALADPLLVADAESALAAAK